MPRAPRPLLKGALIALTAAWEVYAIRGVSEAGVGFLEVALGVPAGHRPVRPRLPTAIPADR